MVEVVFNDLSQRSDATNDKLVELSLVTDPIGQLSSAHVDSLWPARVI